MTLGKSDFRRLAVSQTLFAAVLVSTVLTTSGCAEDVSPNSDEDPVDPSDVWYERTHVTLQPDGNHVVVTTYVSLAQQIAEREAEEAGHSLRAVSIGDCSNDELRIYSLTNYTGYQLCLQGTGKLNIGNICKISLFGSCIDYWGAADDDDVSSIRTGDWGVYFDDTTNFDCCGCSYNFLANYNDSNIQDTEAYSCATWVYRNGTCVVC